TPRKPANDAAPSPLKLSPKKVHIDSAPGDASPSPGKQKDKLSSSFLLTPAKKPALAPTPMALRMKAPQLTPRMDSPRGNEADTQVGHSRDTAPADVASEEETHGHAEQDVDMDWTGNVSVGVEERVLVTPTETLPVQSISTSCSA